jgi:hypothetical protein
MSGLPPGTLHRFSRREFFLPAAAISGCDCLNRSDPSAKNASRPARELLAFVAAAVVLGLSIPSPDTVIVIPVFIGIFLLSVLFYVSPAYPWFNRLGRPRHARLRPAAGPAGRAAARVDGLRPGLPGAPPAWMSAFMGLGVGINIRAMREKNPS